MKIEIEHEGSCLGATGGTGRLIVRDALAKGHSVVALVRSKTEQHRPTMTTRARGSSSSIMTTATPRLNARGLFSVTDAAVGTSNATGGSQ
jgi:hypothetical protein